MKSPIQVLYLLGERESHPPTTLLSAARVLTAQAGNSMDEVMSPTQAPQVITLRTPLDEKSRQSLEALSKHKIPVLGFGRQDDHADAVVSDSISVEDLKSMLDLLCATAAHENYVPIRELVSTAEAPIAKVTENVVWMIENLLNLRIPNYRERAERVYRACQWLGTHLTLPEKDLTELLQAARLREIGKLGIPDQILFAKYGKRTAEAQALYNRYPEFGAMILSMLPSLQGCAKIVQHQLENFDGSGPSRLMSTKIPLPSRILRVAAAFEMASDDGLSDNTTDIVQVVEKGMGSFYDPMLVKLTANYHELITNLALQKRTQRVKLGELQVGMIIAEDLWNRTGVKILGRGTRLTAHILDILLNNPMSPSWEQVEVMK